MAGKTISFNITQACLVRILDRGILSSHGREIQVVKTKACFRILEVIACHDRGIEASFVRIKGGAGLSGQGYRLVLSEYWIAGGNDTGLSDYVSGQGSVSPCHPCLDY